MGRLLQSRVSRSFFGSWTPLTFKCKQVPILTITHDTQNLPFMWYRFYSRNNASFWKYDTTSRTLKKLKIPSLTAKNYNFSNSSNEHHPETKKANAPSDVEDKTFFDIGYKNIIFKAKETIRDDFLKFKKRLAENTFVDDPILNAVCNHYFKCCGKQFRPIIIILISRAINEVCSKLQIKPVAMGPGIYQNDLSSQLNTPSSIENNKSAFYNQIEVAVVSEIIHVASIMHDDVIDGAPFRRMVASTNYKFGNKLSILGGDLLFSRASVCISKIECYKVIQILSSIIQSLVRGEVLQMQSSSGIHSLSKIPPKKLHIDAVDFDSDHELNMLYNVYLERSYLKTASLLCKNAICAATLANAPPYIVESVITYTKNVGVAFQMFDDISDFDSSISKLGKPIGSDLKNGLATIPVLVAAKYNKKILKFISRSFSEPNDVELTLDLIQSSNAIEISKDIAKSYCQIAIDSIDKFPRMEETDLLREFAVSIAYSYNS